MLRFCSLFVIALAACSSSEEPTSTPVDSGTAIDSTTNEVATDTATETSEETSSDSATSEVADATDAGDTKDGGDFCAMTAVGDTCSDTQPCTGDGLCYGFGKTGFCAGAEPQCGGFVMKPCPGGRTCLRASGSSLGYCATDEEKACICSKKADAAITVDGC